MDWQDFLDGLKGGGATLAKDEVKNLVSKLVADRDPFVSGQARQLRTYLDQLASNQISKDEFKDNIQDLKEETSLRLIGLDIAAKASGQRLVNGLQNLVLDGLLKFLP